MMRKILFPVLAAASTVACTAFYEQGVLTEECIEQSSTFNLKDGQKLIVGTDDISFESGNTYGATWIARKADSLEFEGTGSLLVGDIAHSLEDPFSITLSAEAQEAKLVKGGQAVDLTASLNESNVAVLGLTWHCDTGK